LKTGTETIPWASVPLFDNSSADVVKNAISGYWAAYYGATIQVTQYWLDINGSVTTNVTARVKIVNTITVLNVLFNTPSFKFAGSASLTSGAGTASGKVTL
jgi:hypothetical protein